MATEAEKAARDELDALLSALVQFLTGGEFIEAVLKSDVLQTYFVERQSKGADTASLLAEINHLEAEFFKTGVTSEYEL